MGHGHIQIMQDRPSAEIQESGQTVEDSTGRDWELGIHPLFWWEYTDGEGHAKKSRRLNSCPDCCSDIQTAEEVGDIPAGLPIYGSTDCECERKSV